MNERMSIENILHCNNRLFNELEGIQQGDKIVVSIKDISTLNSLNVFVSEAPIGILGPDSLPVINAKMAELFFVKFLKWTLELKRSEFGEHCFVITPLKMKGNNYIKIIGSSKFDATEVLWQDNFFTDRFFETSHRDHIYNLLTDLFEGGKCINSFSKYMLDAFENRLDLNLFLAKNKHQNPKEVFAQLNTITKSREWTRYWDIGHKNYLGDNLKMISQNRCNEHNNRLAIIIIENHSVLTCYIEAIEREWNIKSNSKSNEHTIIYPIAEAFLPNIKSQKKIPTKLCYFNMKRFVEAMNLISIRKEIDIYENALEESNRRKDNIKSF